MVLSAIPAPGDSTLLPFLSSPTVRGNGITGQESGIREARGRNSFGGSAGWALRPDRIRMYSRRYSAGHSSQFRSGLNRLGASELGARDLVVFAVDGGVDGSWGLLWPFASGVIEVSAFFHGHEDHSASLVLAILARSALISSRLPPLLTNSGPRVWADCGASVRGCSCWRLVSSWAATEQDLRRVVLGGSPPSRLFAWASRRLASRPATTDRPRSLIAIFARYWFICRRGRRER